MPWFQGSINVTRRRSLSKSWDVFVSSMHGIPYRDASWSSVNNTEVGRKPFAQGGDSPNLIKLILLPEMTRWHQLYIII